MTKIMIDLPEEVLVGLRFLAQVDATNVNAVIRHSLQSYARQRRHEPAVVSATNAMEQRLQDIYGNLAPITRPANVQANYNLSDMMVAELDDEREQAVSIYGKYLQAKQIVAAASDRIQATVNAYNQRQIELFHQRMSDEGLSLCWCCRKILPGSEIEVFAGLYLRYKGGADECWFSNRHVYRACVGCRIDRQAALVPKGVQEEGYIEIYPAREIDGTFQALIDDQWQEFNSRRFSREDAYKYEVETPEQWQRWNIGGPMAWRTEGLFLGDCKLMP